MDCKTTFTDRGARSQAGLSLIELLVALAVSALVASAVASFFLYTAKSFAGMFNYTDLEQYSQKALDTMTRDIRQATELTAFTTNKLTFRDFDGNPLVFEYSSSSKQLVRKKNGTDQVMLVSCDFFNASIYQRNPIGGVYDYFPTAEAANCKMVSVSWICSRQILGTTMNTESVQTAKIVLRKE